MRWSALGVDYEMCGKDLIDSVTLSSKICRALGAAPPENFIYELFLDETGGKISKSKGNGLTIDEWLTYASPESLSLFMYQKPKAAKRLFFDVIPQDGRRVSRVPRRSTPQEEPKAKLENPVWHIHSGAPPEADLPISFALLLNLVSVSNAEDKATLWGFIRKYAPDATPRAASACSTIWSAMPFATIATSSSRQKTYRLPDRARAHGAGRHWRRSSARPRRARAGEELQNIVYAVGKAARLRAAARLVLGALRGAARAVARARASAASSSSTASTTRGH